MGIKYLLYLTVLSQVIQSCEECKPDKYGEILELVVPITTSPAKDTFKIGDTLSIEANFDKDIEIYNTSNTIKLDSFTFFGLFGVSEISDTVENYICQYCTIVEIGQVGYLPLYDNVIAYPIEFFEDDSGYHLAFKIVLNTSGMFWISLVSANIFYEKSNYDHPALYICENNRRDRIEVYYQNTSTSIKTYNDIFLKPVGNLKSQVNFDNYQKGGGIIMCSRIFKWDETCIWICYGRTFEIWLDQSTEVSFLRSMAGCSAFIRHSRTVKFPPFFFTP